MAEATAHKHEIDWQRLLHEALTAPGNMGNTYDRFYNYSFLNKVLLMMQGVREPVATRQRWTAIGRVVLENAAAKEIIRPVFAKPKAGEPEANSRLIGFTPVKCIYTLSDTKGSELPPITLPQWDVEAALQKLHITQVPFDELNGNIHGFSHGREIAVSPLSHHRSKTLMHELGHVILGHTMPKSHAEYATHRGIKEFQAEATAYLTMYELGQLDEETASRSRAYVQHWLANEQRPSDWSIRQVFSATDRILKAGLVAVGVAGMSEMDAPLYQSGYNQ